jgi:hypothetical protein
MRGSDGSPANGAWADGTRCNHAMAAIIEVPEEAGAPEGQGGKRPRNERKRNFCPHQRHKSQCRECGGSGLCVHGRHKRAGARSAEAPASARTSARACVQGVVQGVRPGTAGSTKQKTARGSPRASFFPRGQDCSSPLKIREGCGTAGMQASELCNVVQDSVASVALSSPRQSAFTRRFTARRR